MSYIYKIYGLHVESEFQISGLLECGVISSADILISYGNVPYTLDNKSNKTYKQDNFEVDDNRCLFIVNKIARFLVINYSDRCSVIVELCENVHENDMQVFLLGSVFSIILHYRDYLVLHGSAVFVDGKAIIFSGNSGVGKSTLAATFYKSNYEIITDDVCVIRFSDDGVPRIMPGFLYLKLWEDAVINLNKSVSDLKQVYTKFNKFELPIVRAQHVDIPISHIYVLDKEHVLDLSIARVSGMKKMECLVNNTYRYQFLKGQDKLFSHFKQCSMMAKAVTCYQVKRPSMGYDLDKLMQAIKTSI